MPNGEGLALPAYQSALAAGLDLLAAIPEDAPIILAPGKYALVPDRALDRVAAGYEAQVRPRSGLAARHGVTVLNAPGTVDADYRGEIGVPLINHGERAVHGPARRAHRADGDCARGSGGARSGDDAIPHRARQRRFRLDRPLIA